ncbi:hypothetical protein BX070DRAFT_219654 [Coemansia spiralis]|nr:hypothetical protein BX070DRAFT_219654 [Coemansia spiralis]
MLSLRACLIVSLCSPGAALAIIILYLFYFKALTHRACNSKRSCGFSRISCWRPGKLTESNYRTALLINKKYGATQICVSH